MSYYDIDAILTDAQKVPCTFALDIPGLGSLDGNQGGDIQKNTQTPLPLWLAEPLAVQLLAPSPSSSSSLPRATWSQQTQQTVIALDIPAALGTRVMNALDADARSVDVRAQSAYFYALAARVGELFEGEGWEGVGEAFRKRAAEIADQAHNPRSGGAVGDGTEFLRGLDEWERALFRAQHEGSKGVREWMRGLRRR